MRDKKISNQEITNLKKTPIKSKKVVSIYEKKKKNGINEGTQNNTKFVLPLFYSSFMPNYAIFAS